MLNYVTTLVCIVNRDGIPLAGIINRPFMEEEPVMYGVVETGDIYGLEPTVATGRSEKRVTVSRSHAGDANDVVAKYFAPKKSLPAGGAGYKSWLVLTGKADAYVHTTKIKTWDLCAGHAIIEAAGGRVTDRSGNELKYLRDVPASKNGLVSALVKSRQKGYVQKLA